MVKRPTRGDKPQKRRDLRLTRRQVLAHEYEQAGFDMTAYWREEILRWQRSFNYPVIKTGKSGSLLRDPVGTPTSDPCMLMGAANNVTALAYDWATYECYVANGDRVDVFQQRGMYWVRVRSINVGESVVRMSVNASRLVAVTATNTYYYPPQAAARIDLTGAVDDVLSWSRLEDTADWQGAFDLPDFWIAVTESDRVDIYDVGFDVPELVRSETIASPTRLAYREGQLYVGNASGVTQFDWITGEEAEVISGGINDVAAIVAPDAPAKPGYTVAVPDVAAASGNAVRHLRANGDLWSITGFGSTVDHIDFLLSGDIVTEYAATDEIGVFLPLTENTTISSYSRRYYPTSKMAQDGGSPKYLLASGAPKVASGGYDVLTGSTSGFSVINENVADPPFGVATHITSMYNTGPMSKVIGAYFSAPI
jgi:hypothetical protein